jgi:hypothetical protein
MRVLSVVDVFARECLRFAPLRLFVSYGHAHGVSRVLWEFPGMSKTQKPTASEIWSNEALSLAPAKSGFKIRIGEIERRLDRLRHLLAARDPSKKRFVYRKHFSGRPACHP